MRRDLLEILACPVCRVELRLEEEEMDGDEVISGKLICTRCEHPYRIKEGIPRMLTPELEKELGLTNGDA